MRTSAYQKLVSPLAIVISAVVHALVLLGASAAPSVPSERALPRPPDTWSATTVDVGTEPEARPTAASPRVEPQRAIDEATDARAERSRDEAVPRDAPRAASRAERPKPKRDAVNTEPKRDAVNAKPKRDAVNAEPKRDAVNAEPKPSSPAASASPPASANATGAIEPAPPGGSFGALGLPPGVRHLGTAFTRALPAGAYMDLEWSELPLGPLGTVTVTLHINEAGALEEVELHPKTGVPAVLERMVRRAALLLKSGRFSLDPRQVSAGVEHFGLEVTLSERQVTPDELAQPHHLFAQSSESPTHQRPGHAQFTLNSGRHVRAVVRLVEDVPH